MRYHPIIFSGPMVRAIRERRKTQTRRIVTVAHAKRLGLDHVGNELVTVDGAYWNGRFEGGVLPWSPYAVGDRLWVREMLRRGDWEANPDFYHGGIKYAADGEWAWDVEGPAQWVWQRAVLPSIHMPRGLSRITLEVTQVRVERVRDISEEDAMAAGRKGTAFGPGPNGSEGILPSDQFRELWDSLYAKAGFGWDINPWVWAYTFTPITGKEADNGNTTTPTA
jgi:hypothetical protein